MSMQYKFALTVNGKTFMYASYDDAMKMAKFCGLPMVAIKEIHIF